jgi:hypothetical protein
MFLDYIGCVCIGVNCFGFDRFFQRFERIDWWNGAFVI